MKKIKYIIFFILLAALVFLIYSINSASKTEAQIDSVPSVSGYANFLNLESGGSSSPAIYFSGSNGGSTGNMPFQVQYSPTTGLTGYAWSPIYGWIQFNGTSANVLSFQNDGESTNWATGYIDLGPNTNGGSTGNMSYDVEFDPVTGAADATNHWAWGGNVLGWIDFSGVTVSVEQDLCSNIVGVQYTVPSGYVQMGTQCLEDLCPLDAGVQSTLPCPNGDYCPNLSGIQMNVPSGYTLLDNNCVIIPPPSCPTGQILVNGICISINPISACTESQLNDFTIDSLTGIGTPTSWPCYCSVHRTEVTPVDCVTFCLNNPTSCTKKPTYVEN
jgi:hypothetical protein